MKIKKRSVLGLLSAWKCAESQSKKTPAIPAVKIYHPLATVLKNLKIELFQKTNIMTSFCYFLRAEAAKTSVFQPGTSAPRHHNERAKVTDRYYKMMLWENSKQNFSLSPELERGSW